MVWMICVLLVLAAAFFCWALIRGGSRKKDRKMEDRQQEKAVAELRENGQKRSH